MISYTYILSTINVLRCRHWWRPTSSAGVERLFSMLTHIDVASRNRMLAPLLHDVLYLMGNRKIVDQLIAEGAFRLGEQPRTTLVQDTAAIAAAAAVFAAASAPDSEDARLGPDSFQAPAATKKPRIDGPKGPLMAVQSATAAAFVPAPAAAVGASAAFSTVSLPLPVQDAAAAMPAAEEDDLW